jgi:hypothetical protein
MHPMMVQWGTVSACGSTRIRFISNEWQPQKPPPGSLFASLGSSPPTVKKKYLTNENSTNPPLHSQEVSSDKTFFLSS